MNTEHLDILIADHEGIQTGFYDEDGRSAPSPENWQPWTPDGPSLTPDEI